MVTSHCLSHIYFTACYWFCSLTLFSLLLFTFCFECLLSYVYDLSFLLRSSHSPSTLIDYTYNSHSSNFQLHMAHQAIQGWPLGLRPVNERLLDFSLGSISFTTFLTASPTNSSISSSDIDTQSTGSVFQSTGSFFHDESKTLGSLIGVSNIAEVSRRSSRTTTRPEIPRIISLKPTKPWLFSFCSKLTTDAVLATNHRTKNPSLGHFLEAERRALSTTRANQIEAHVRYGPNDYSPVTVAFSGSNSLFVNGIVAPNPSSASGVSSNGAKSNSELLVPLLFPRLCGQLIKC